MTRLLLWISALAIVCSFAIAFAFAGEPKTGVIKGTITVGGRPTADAVVSVQGVAAKQGAAQSSSSKKPAVIDQRDLKFIPRVLAISVRTTVDFPNHDKTFHNVFSNSEPKKFDLGLYPSGQSRSVNFDKPGIVKILCNVHPNMEAYVVVKDHFYFSATDARGSYAIGGVPLGKYRVEIWHPDLGTTLVPVELVREGQVSAIDLDLKKK